MNDKTKPLTFSLGELFGLPPKPLHIQPPNPQDGEIWKEPCNCGRGSKVFEALGGKWISRYSVFDGGKDFDRYGEIPACRQCEDDEYFSLYDPLDEVMGRG